MKIETTQIEIVRADEGFYLTQKHRTEDDAPIMTDSLYNPTWEYIEIPKSEGDAIMVEFDSATTKLIVRYRNGDQYETKTITCNQDNISIS